MSQTQNIRRAAVAAAVGAVFAGAAGSASAVTILGAGASAVKNSVQLIVLKDYCAAGTINFYDTGTATISPGGQPGGGIFRIQCSASSISGFNASVDIGYDTNGGSWKAFTAVNPALFSTATSQNTAFNANPVATVQTTGCTLQSSIAMAVLGQTFTINYNYGCAQKNLVPGTDVVSFGLTDVEGALFVASTDNQPLVNNSWTTNSSTGPLPIYSNFGIGTELSGFPQQVFGVVFGVGVSPKLYAALVADQKATGILSTSCPSVAPAGVLTVAQEACAPIITRAQYASIIAASGGTLNASLAPLFSSIIPATTTFELARRDQGSGTQASSNAFFLNDGCGSAATELFTNPQIPYGSANNVSYNATTGAVQGKLQAPTLPDSVTGFAIGVISVENESKFSAGAGFLRLDGFYPSVANAKTGLYSYVSEENLHANPTLTGDALTFVTDLTATSGTSPKLSESAYNYGLSTSVNGIVPLYSTLNTGAAYGNGAALCAGWQHL
jgi:hypothetical protein